MRVFREPNEWKILWNKNHSVENDLPQNKVFSSKPKKDFCLPFKIPQANFIIPRKQQTISNIFCVLEYSFVSYVPEYIWNDKVCNFSQYRINLSHHKIHKVHNFSRTLILWEFEFLDIENVILFLCQNKKVCFFLLKMSVVGFKGKGTTKTN